MDSADIEALGKKLSGRAYLATLGASGEPHVVPVHPGWEGTTIWIMTGAASVKAANVAGNPKMALHWETNGDGHGLLVWGTAAVHADLATKQRLWHGVFDYDLSRFAPAGPPSPDVATRTSSGDGPSGRR